MIRLMVLTLAASIGGCPAKQEAVTRDPGTRVQQGSTTEGGKSGGGRAAQQVPTHPKEVASDDSPPKPKGSAEDQPLIQPKPNQDSSRLRPRRRVPLGTPAPPKPLPPVPPRLEAAGEPKLAQAGDDETDGRGRTTLRAGALRVEAYQKSDGYYVRYATDPTLRIAGLSAALGKRRLGARVASFTQLDGAGSVQQGGQIVAVAVAQQLQASGWLVDLANPSAMQKAARELIPPADLSRALAELVVSGRIRFATSTTADVTVAAIDGQVAFAEGPTAIVECKVAAEARIPASEVAAISQRLERATREALRSFVRLLFKRQDLASKLIAFVKTKQR
jgi:hypothetical protein